MLYPPSIQKLIELFSKLPTVGPKTAERYVFYLLKQPTENLQALAQSIAELKEKIIICKSCMAIAEKSPCEICLAAGRDHGIICITAGVRDMISIEATKQYNGRYFILGGTINAISGIGPEKLFINQLLHKLKTEKISEIIIALNPDIEGETTSMYLTKIIKPFNIKITRLARGLPVGADLEYADQNTLTNALRYRNEIK